MKKMAFALALLLSLPCAALATMDYRELRGTWQVSGTIYRMADDAPADTMPWKKIGALNPFVLEIGVEDYQAGYADWSQEEMGTILAALEAFATGGLIGDLNGLIGQLTKTPYLCLPEIGEFHFKDPDGNPTGVWVGQYFKFYDVVFPQYGTTLTLVSWLVGNSWQLGLDGRLPEVIRKQYEKIIAKGGAGTNGPYVFGGTFSEINQNKVAWLGIATNSNNRHENGLPDEYLYEVILDRIQ